MMPTTICRCMALLCSVALTSCGLSVNGLNVGKIADVTNKVSKGTQISQAEELILGDQLAAMLLGASRLHPNQQWQHYVNQVGRHLANHSHRAELPWTFAVLDTPDINAFAVPGGYVFITSGLLANLQSEAELAGVLSHEIMHIDRRHQLREIERQNKLDIVQSIGSVAAEYHAEHNQRPSLHGYRNQLIAESVLTAGHSLYIKGLSRDDELEADTLAVRLAARAGYDPFALAALMQRLDGLTDDHGVLSLLLSTHPSPQDRLAALQHTLPALPADRPYATAELRFRQIFKTAP